ELIVAAGPGSVPHVLVFTDSDHDRAVSDNPILESFLAFDAGFGGGVYVAAGQIESMGSNGAEIIAGAGAGSTATVRIFSDKNNTGIVADDAVFEEFTAYGGGFAGGVRVAAGDTDNSGTFVEVITVSGPGSSHVQIFDDNNDPGVKVSDNPATDSFLAYPSGYSAGAFVAFGKFRAESYGYAGLPQSIPDNSSMTSSIFVPGTAGIIRDL